MKTIRHTSTLYYYDGPQVFEARDAIGGHYLAVMIEPEAGRERCLVAGVEPERLRQFRTGALDLRTLLLERGEPEWYLALPNGDLNAPLALQPQATPLASFAHLPDPGFLLHDRPALAETLREARARNNLVMEVAVEPPEAAPKLRILTLRDQRVLLDADLARLYGVETRSLNQAVKRNADRFPPEFAFPLTRKEILGISQTVTSLAQLKFYKRVQAFTEHGSLQAANILNTPSAVRMSLYILRAFMKMRGELAENVTILKRLAEIDRQLLEHDTDLRALWMELQPLLVPNCNQ
jgi:hypothetical protein